MIRSIYVVVGVVGSSGLNCSESTVGSFARTATEMTFRGIGYHSLCRILHAVSSAWNTIPNRFLQGLVEA
eukprot:scaffold103445_cov58-Attheya_sp.AAC.3